MRSGREFRTSAINPPTQLVVTSAPLASIPSGTPFGLAVTVEDSFNNPVPSYNNLPVTLVLNSGPIGATFTPVTVMATGGVATFTNLMLTDKIDDVLEKLKISGPPAVFVFNKEGGIAKKFSDEPPVDYADIEKLVVELLKK